MQTIQRIKSLDNFKSQCCVSSFYFLNILIAAIFIAHCGSEKLPTTSLTEKIAAESLTEINYGTPHECGSLDIRNECASFQLLENCTVIKGYLMIVLLPRDRKNDTGEETCDYDNIQFPLLREITDYIIFFHVKKIKTIRFMFPNLTVIRGRRLFLNYAIGITEMSDLEVLEFTSLIAIQRGHVFIGTSPKLCQLDKIAWDRLTLTTGQNHIFPVAPERCSEKAFCSGCTTEYCWSNNVCQKFENDNIIDPLHNIQHCHEECLGGCYNSTNAGCGVCRRLTDHGICVKACPIDKFLHEHSQRCYTNSECTEQMGLLTHQGMCVSHCPSGFGVSQNNSACEPCGNDNACINVCQAETYPENVIIIYSLSDADRLAGCQIVNASLIIVIRNKIYENDLVRTLGSIREIIGYLRIFRSPYLTNLKFLDNLKKIHGKPSESNYYSLIIYDNKDLNDLWTPRGNCSMERGGMYIHLNNKLCNHKIQEFKKKVSHDHSRDSIQTSDQETLCGPVKLLLEIQVLSHRELLFSWPKENTFDEIEIMHRPVPKSEPFNEETELNTPICQRINWHRELIFQEDLNDNGTHYSYAIDGLQQNTKYACLIKTFDSDYNKNARSDLVFITTRVDVPPPPSIVVVKKTNISITIDLNAQNISLDYMVERYLLEVYEKTDDANYLDKRNYCLQPAYLAKDILSEAYVNSVYDEDYDDCCERLEENVEEKQFVSDMHDEFSCSLNRKHRCGELETVHDSPKPLISLRLNQNESLHTLNHLKKFHLYVIMVKACNFIGCSSFGIHNERTNYTTAADVVGHLEGCHMPDSTEYRVFFTEPKNPNGVIVSFVVHFRQYIPNADIFHSHISCTTRLEHQNANNIVVRHINSSFNEIAVRAHSLAGDTITSWHPITPCDAVLLAASTKLAGFENNKLETHTTKYSVNIFLIFFLLGCAGTGLWVCYKRRYWRLLPDIRRYLPAYRPPNVRSLVHHDISEDRQILVDNFERVRFQNTRDDDDDDNDTTISNFDD